MAGAQQTQRNRYFMPTGNGHYTPVGLDEWARWFGGDNMHSFDTGGRVVGQTEVGGVTVSTVFLGMDHNHSLNGPPLLFETMIFGGLHDDYQRRYSTLAEAQAGHQEAVAMVGD